MRIEHVGLFVSDLEKARAFYEKYFAAAAGEKYHNPRTGFSSYFLTFSDGARLELGHLDHLANDSENRLGFAHLAISLGSKEEVNQKVDQLTKDGFTLTSGPRVTGDGYYEAVVLDLDGNKLELTI